MSSPPVKAVRQFDFTDFSTSNPGDQQPGVSLDAEFDVLKIVSDKTIDRLGELQRDDGALRNQIVTPDSMSASSLALMAGTGVPRGLWATLTAYAVKDITVQSGATYICVTPHTAGVFATDLAASKWILFTIDAVAVEAAAVATSTALAVAGQWAIAAGTSDAITAAFPTTVTVLTDGMIVSFRALLANLTTAPTFKADGTAAHVITRGGGAALVLGDIAGNHAEVFLRYYLAGTRWELINPASIKSINGMLDMSGASGGQIKFPVTQNPSADPNTLDDFEKGTFTPIFNFGSLQTGIIYAAQVGRYEKIGNRVLFSIYVHITNKGSAVGAATVELLPFSSTAAASALSGGGMYMSSMSAGTGSLMWFMSPSQTNLNLRHFSAGVDAALTDANFTNITDFALSGVYEAAS